MQDSGQIVHVRNGWWAAARVATTLRFSKFVTISAGAATAANIRIVPTFAYDVDPTVVQPAWLVTQSMRVCTDFIECKQVEFIALLLTFRLLT